MPVLSLKISEFSKLIIDNSSVAISVVFTFFVANFQGELNTGVSKRVNYRQFRFKVKNKLGKQNVSESIRMDFLRTTNEVGIVIKIIEYIRV